MYVAALKVDENDYDARYNLAILLLHDLNDPAGAESHFVKCLEQSIFFIIRNRKNYCKKTCHGLMSYAFFSQSMTEMDICFGFFANFSDCKRNTVMDLKQDFQKITKKNKDFLSWIMH